jgi:L-cystine uptake protein TcyP (sodium:dicarboxylate symporter family)
MVMKQITQKHELEAMGGFSDERLRFFILGFMSLSLIMSPFIGMVASFIVVLIFAIFIAVKINEFQQSNPESILRHRQAMDRMYNYGAKAEYYELLLKPYEKKRIVSKATKHKTAEKMSNINNLNFALSR